MKTTDAGSTDRARERRVGVLGALAVVLSLAASPFACRRSDDGLRGQSGSEAPAGMGGSGGSSNISDESPPCPCGAPGVFLRVTLLPSRDGRRTLRVEQVIQGATDHVPGDELEVEDSGTLPCFSGSAPVADGQEALAAFTPADAADSGAPDGGGVDGSVRLTPWGEQLLFALVGETRLSVPSSELPRLWSDEVDACIERHGDVWQLLDRAASGADDGGP